MHTLLSINNYYYVRGGAEAVFLAHNDMFSSRGWNVVPFCMQHEKNFQSEWSSHFVDEIELGRDYGPIERLTKSAKAIYSFEAKRNVERLVDQIVPDVAHGHNIYHHISPAILSSLKKKGIPVFLTLHDLKIACPAYRMINSGGICEKCNTSKFYNALTNRCMHGSAALSAWVMMEAYVHRLLGSYSRNVHKFVVPSKFYIEKFIEWGWPKDKLVYIPNFVDLEDIDPEFAAGKPYFYFGRLSAEKGLETLIQAVSCSGSTLWIAGTGPEEAKLKALTQKLGAHVEFLGFVAGDALFDRIRAARAIVLPSEWYENAPISVLEAFACGKPVIGADIGGIPELVGADRGMVFTAFSVDSLSGALEQFAGLPDREVEQAGRRARTYVESVHSRDAYFRSCESLYLDALDREK